MRRGCLGDEEAALGRRAEGRVPVCLRYLLDGPGLETRSGRVDENVEAAELLDRQLDERSRVLGAGQVAVLRAGREDLPVLAPEPRDDRRAELPRAACDESPHVWGV